MNPIVYNKNGQFRFTDFVGYLPEFLRSEPDVVTYLQVMSDYINNAYRNVEITEEFELVKVCSSSDRTEVQHWMEKLCAMFKLATDRGEHVLYLSVPRNNIKSNVIVGNETAEYERSIKVDLDEIAESISSASSRIGSIDSIDDGDIVYVIYEKRQLNEKVAYYYVKKSDTLVMDSMATSQDPFTNTYNDPSTAIQFKVIDVGNVVSRYGGNHGDSVYYEVYFTVHITNVERVSANGMSTYDVNSDGKDDTIIVDYYNLNSATNSDDGSYYTYVKFAENNGFAWNGDFPTGMFYFRDSSSSRLTNLNNSGTMDLADPINSPSVDRYHITDITKQSGVYRIYMEAFPGIYSNALFYIASDSKNLGVYRMTGNVTKDTRFDEGELYIDVVNVSGVDYGIETLVDTERLTLISIPLASSKYIVDFDNSMPVVKWNAEVSDLFENVIGGSSNITMKRAKVTSNKLIYSGPVERQALNVIQIPGIHTDVFRPYMWIVSNAFKSLDGKSPYYVSIGRVEVVNGYTRISIDRGGINTSAIISGRTVDIYDVSAGYISTAADYNEPSAKFAYYVAEWDTINNPINPNDIVKVTVVNDHIVNNVNVICTFSDNHYTRSIVNSSLAGIATVGSVVRLSDDIIGEDIFVVNAIEGETVFEAPKSTGTIGLLRYATATISLTEEKLLTVVRANPTDHIIMFEKPVGYDLVINPMEPISRVMVDTGDLAASIYKCGYTKMLRDGTRIATAAHRAYEGDIYTAEYMLANVNGSSAYSLLKMVTDVKRIVDVDRVYTTGEYLYDANNNNVVKVTRNTNVSDDGTIIDSNSYIIDRIAHYSVGLKEMRNTYIPYCGAISVLDYDEKPDYVGNMKVTRVPLYIKKLNDVRLKYGWEQRQYLYYHDDIGVGNRDRSGFIEMYAGNSEDENENSPVTVNLRKHANVLSSSAMLYGCGERYYIVDVDELPIAKRNNDGTWTITIKSSGHGLQTGATIVVSVNVNDLAVEEVFGTDNAEITVLSLDTFQYTTSPEHNDLIAGYVITLSSISDITVNYDRSYDQYTEDSVGYPMDGDIVVVGATKMDANSITNYEYRDDAYPMANDNEVWIGGTVYTVTSGSWKAINSTELLSPSTIYCRHNLFDESSTNPTFAMSDGYVINSITADGEIQTSMRIPEFDTEYAQEIYEGKGRVYIENVNQSVFCGWHTIKKIHNGGSFSIYMDQSILVDSYIAPVTNRQMTVHVGHWYKYTLNGYDWDKKSNIVSYVTSNQIMEKTVANSRIIKTKYVHNLNKGDYVIIDETGSSIYDIEYGLSGILTNRVESVIDEYTVELETDLGNHTGYIFRGYVIDEMNLSRLYGEYTIVLNGEKIKFTTGDIVITLGQVCLDECRAWRVTERTAWVPMAAKRTFKIDRMSIDMQRNPAYDIGDDFDTESEYRYVTYTDSDVFNDNAAYRVGYACARNYHFEHPYVENLDTTQKTELEYSSKYDYATVAPRDGMDPSFHGVPDMGYPLAERIERLAYLRDPEVIDIDLIGYLARFMGYDITAVADDIRSSNVYNNSEERESAIREAIAHLPQFYSLSGTKAGINMLMATFGLVGELVTMWTNTNDPYGELIRQDEVAERMDIDQAKGKTTSSWVPTPHVVLDIIENSNFNSVLMGNEELTRMKEQIRRCKPINVVFDGIRVVYRDIVESKVTMATSGGSIKDSTYLITSDNTDIIVEEDPCMVEDCDF